MKVQHLVGLLLWRGGLLMAGGWGFYRGARLVLRYFEFPTQIEVGLSLVICGLAFVMVSLILDARTNRLAPGDER